MPTSEELLTELDEALENAKLLAPKVVDAAADVWSEWATYAPRFIVQAQPAIIESLTDEAIRELKRRLADDRAAGVASLRASLPILLEDFAPTPGSPPPDVKGSFSRIEEALREQGRRIEETVTGAGFVYGTQNFAFYTGANNFLPLNAVASEWVNSLALYRSLDFRYNTQLEVERTARAAARFEDL